MFIDFLTNLLGEPPEILLSSETLLYIMGFIILIYIIKACFSLFYLVAGIFNTRDD